MKIAVVYNRDSKSVINLFGMPNRETIKRLAVALKKGGHQVISLEADKNLVDRLEDFMLQVIQGERPGMVFNVSYGLQGQARYAHVPSILEMVGIPYVGSSPLGHSLALDKVVTKMLLRQRGVPTPDFAVLDTPAAELPPDLTYPMILKPKNEAVSFGLKVVDGEHSLRKAAGRAKCVIVLGPVHAAGDLVTNRRRARRYRLSVKENRCAPASARGGCPCCVGPGASSTGWRR